MSDDKFVKSPFNNFQHLLRDEQFKKTLEKAHGTKKLPKSSVVYVPANKDGSHKACTNCPMYLKDTNRCSIHSKDVHVGAGPGWEMVCSYWITGKPVNEKDGHLPMHSVEPEWSGLTVVKGKGTICGNCTHWLPGQKCDVVSEKDQPNPGKIGKMDCCGVWMNPELEEDWKTVQEELKDQVKKKR